MWNTSPMGRAADDADATPEPGSSGVDHAGPLHEIRGQVHQHSGHHPTAETGGQAGERAPGTGQKIQETNWLIELKE